MTKLPKTLYKFRDWSNLYNRRLIVENEIYFSNNYSFNDPFDLQLPVQFYGKPPFDEKMFNESFKAQYNRVPTKIELSKARNFHLESEIEPDFIKEITAKYEIETKKVEDNLGVFCLSKRNESTLMWGHYSNSHYGFCVGLDTIKLNQFIVKKFKNNQGILEVKYDDSFPKLDLANGDFEYLVEYSIDRFRVKYEHWKYEDEVRIILKNMANKSLKIPPEIISEIIFGYKMDESQKKEIKIICDNLYPTVKYFKAKKNKDKFEMKIIPC